MDIDLEDLDLVKRADAMKENLKNEMEDQAKESMSKAADEAKELMAKYSSG